AGPPAAAGEAGADDEQGSRFPSDFLGLLISLGAQGSMLLMGGPEGEPPDLDGARSLIELLGVLKEKTEGRRTPQEDQLIDGLLYELRMAFVQATKAAGRWRCDAPTSAGRWSCARRRYPPSSPHRAAGRQVDRRAVPADARRRQQLRR